MARTVALWIFGILASAIFGGLIGDYLDGNAYGGEGGIWGALGGIFAFACARLWLARPAERT